MTFKIALVLALGLSLGACASTQPVIEEIGTMPVMRWDHRPEATLWTEATLTALRADPTGLPSLTPTDITVYCPDYPNATEDERAAFWAGLLSALAKHESTWNPVAVGGGGRWFGLVQIDPRTAQGYGCNARTGQALKNGAANLQCAVRIATAQVSKRGTVSRGMLDWGPFHSEGKRADMKAWTREQSYCQAS